MTKASIRVTKAKLVDQITSLNGYIQAQNRELIDLRFRLSIAERNGLMGETLPLFTKSRIPPHV